jgi:hypothetical protein
MLEYPLRLGPSRLFPLYLENRLHDAAIYSQRRPVRRRRKLASEVGRDRCDSSTVANRFSRDDGRTFLKNSFSISVFDLISCLAITSTKPATPSKFCRPGKNTVRRYAGSSYRLCDPSRYRRPPDKTSCSELNREKSVSRPGSRRNPRMRDCANFLMLHPSRTEHSQSE